MPRLSIHFSRQGYGANVSLAAKALIPERLPKQSLLTFAARLSEPVCIGLRFMDRDGEVWGYDKPELEYQPFCVSPDHQWTSFSAPIRTHYPGWFKCLHSGNVDLGNNVLDAEVLALVTLELGLDGQGYLMPGSDVVDIRSIQLKPVLPHKLSNNSGFNHH